MLMEQFSRQLNDEIDHLDDNTLNNRKTREQLKQLQQAHSMDALIEQLRQINHPDHVRLVADSPAFHALILANPEPFLTLFSRDHLKAIIHQACQLGNLTLVRFLVEKIKLDVTLEKIASPHQNFSPLEDGTYEFQHSSPLCQVAAYCQSVELMLYALSFYKLNHINKTATHGDLQIALTIAAEHCSYDIVRLLLSCGINVNSVREAKHATTALYYAVLHGPLTLIDFLISNGANISYLNQYHAVRRGRLDVVELFVSKGISFNNTKETPLYLTAIESGSIAMVKYFQETLKINLHESAPLTEAQQKRMGIEIIKSAALSGSTSMMKFIEEELHIPVTTIIQEELQTTEHYHQVYGDFILVNAVHSYNTELLIFLFETQGLKPTPIQVSQLMEYAYNNHRCMPQHKVLTTHAYLYSLYQPDLSVQPLLSKTIHSQHPDQLSHEELFLLFAVYTKNFKQTKIRMQYNQLLRENSIYLSDEIARRNISKKELLHLAKHNEAPIVSSILYYLIVSGQGYLEDELLELLLEPIFNVNTEVEEKIYPLHLAIEYKKFFLIPTLLKAGADPDEMNATSQTALTMIEPNQQAILFEMLKHAKRLVNSFNDCIAHDEPEHLRLLLKHTKGHVPDIDLMIWLKQGRHASSIVFDALCYLNDETFSKAEAGIKAMNDPWWLKVLDRATEFRTHERKDSDESPTTWLAFSLFSIGKISGSTQPTEAAVIEKNQNP